MVWQKYISDKELWTIIKLGLILMFTVGLPMLILIIVSIIGEHKQFNRNIIIESQMEISQVMVDGSYGYGRGGISISRDDFFESPAVCRAFVQ